MLSVLAALVVVGSAAATSQLPGMTTSANFYPCPDDTTPATPPTVAECTDTTPKVTATCNPDGVSTLSMTRSGFSSPPYAGTYTETINWSIGPQTSVVAGLPEPLPPQAAFFPFPGPPSESHGFPAGRLMTLTANFTITSGATVIQGTRSFVGNDGNWGICRTFSNEAGPPNYPAPMTGYFYVLNAGVLSYDITSGIPAESGLAESYVSHSYATCCGTENPQTSVAVATGSLREGFGTTHAASGTSNTVTVSPGTNVQAAPLPGVSLTFPTVGTEGPASATAVLTSSAPVLPENFSLGEPPATYNITATGPISFPVVVCIGYGSQPPGTTPALMHFEGGTWVDKTDNVYGAPDYKVCGDVDSLSPFAAAFKSNYTMSGPFEPVNTDVPNSAKAGQTIPVKFSLGGDKGLNVFAANYPRSDSGSCPGGPSDDIETTSNGSGLTYDAATGVYTYHWQTSKKWAGQCRMLTVKFNDGSSEFQATFQFK
jgi:hypothetical protein